MTRPLALAATLALTTVAGAATAHADEAAAVAAEAPSRNTAAQAYIGAGGVMVAIDTFQAYGEVQAGLRVTGPVWLRARAGVGESAELFGEAGPAYEAMAGVELRGCPTRWTCAFGGVDLGITGGRALDSGWFSNDTMVHAWRGVATEPRFGIEIGPGAFAVRASIAGRVFTPTEESFDGVMKPADELETKVGASFELGVIGRF